MFIKSNEYFNSEEARELMVDNGITWSIKEMVKQVYDYSYSEFARKIQAYSLNLHDGLLDDFNSEAKQLRSQGHYIDASLKNFIKYGKAKLEDCDTTLYGVLYANEDESRLETTFEQSDTEDVNEDATEEATEEATSDTVFTMCFTLQDKNVAVRYSLSDGLVTANSNDDILDAIAFLTEQLQ